MITIRIGNMWNNWGNVWECDFTMKDGRKAIDHVKNIPAVKKWMEAHNEDINDWIPVVRFEDAEPIIGDLMTYSACSCQIRMVIDAEVNEKLLVLIPDYYMIDMDERRRLEKKKENKIKVWQDLGVDPAAYPWLNLRMC